MLRKSFIYLKEKINNNFLFEDKVHPKFFPIKIWNSFKSNMVV